MSKLIGMNPRMTPLTMCPGTQSCMPPEALVNPPRYSNKLDCFSHGVLTIQIATRQFPNPGDAHVEDQEGLFRQVPERERRKKDIDLVDPNHPLLPHALNCIQLRPTERPSADELCGRLATLKGEQMYTRSVEQSREQSVSVQTLQQQIREKEVELARARANQEEVQDELERARASHQQQVQEKVDELGRVRANHETELQQYARKIQEKSDELERARATITEQQENYESVIEQLHNENRKLCQTQEQLAMAEKLPVSLFSLHFHTRAVQTGL